MLACDIRVWSQSQNAESRRREIKRWLAGQGHDPKTATWYEDKETGKTLDRPALDGLQRAIFDGEAKTAVVRKLDRLSRRRRGGINLLAGRCGRGVRAVSVTQQLGPAGPVVGRIVAGVLFGVAETKKSRKEREKLSRFARRRRNELAEVRRRRAAQTERQRRHRDRLLARMQERARRPRRRTG